MNLNILKFFINQKKEYAYINNEISNLKNKSSHFKDYYGKYSINNLILNIIFLNFFVLIILYSYNINYNTFKNYINSCQNKKYYKSTPFGIFMSHKNWHNFV